MEISAISTHSSSSSSSTDSTQVDLSTELAFGPSTSTERKQHQPSLFVKVDMEGFPYGRKMNLFEHDGYNDLITALGHMFRINIVLCGPYVGAGVHSDKYLLTYEDKKGDWMMVGDVPWEAFLTSVKRLKIRRAERCIS